MSRFTMGLTQKSLTGIGTMLLVALAVGSSLLYRAEALARESRAQIASAQQRLQQAVQWRSSSELAVSRMTSVLISGDAQLKAYLQPAMAQDTPRLVAMREALTRTARSEREREQLERIAGLGKAVVQEKAALLSLGDRVGRDELQKAIRTEFLPVVHTYQQAIAAFADHQNDLISAEFRQADERVDALHRAGAVAALVLVIGPAVISIGLSRSVVRPIQMAIAAAEAVAEGDLSRDIPIQGDCDTSALLGALHRMRQALQGIVGQVRMSSESIAIGSGQIAAGNADLSRRTERQASSLQETAASVEQLATTARGHAEALTEAVKAALAVETATRRGDQATAQVLATMQDIEGVANAVKDIVGAIDTLAFQSNLLALNAAVEAARAGEHGRGFAVVASEVRRLALRTAEAGAQIRAVIESNSIKVQQGSLVVKQAQEVIQDIASLTQVLTQQMRAIDTATAEQRAGVEQIHGAVQSMDQVTQMNAALVEQSASAAQSLAEQASCLMQQVGHFRLASVA